MIEHLKKVINNKFILLTENEETHIFIVEVDEYIDDQGNRLPIDRQEFATLEEAKAFAESIS